MKRALALLLAIGTGSCARASTLDDPLPAMRPPLAGMSAPPPPGAAPPGTGADQAGAPAAPLDAESLLASSCRRYTELTERLPANILFVLDRSGSMICNPPPITSSADCERDSQRASSDPSKWEITQQALVESLKILPDDARVGMSYFSNDVGCGVQADPSVPLSRNSQSQKELIATSLSSVQPSGPTPLVGATILAYQHLHQLARDGLIRGNGFVVLITDGKQSASCSDPLRCGSAEQCTQLLIDQEVSKAAAPGVGIRTFVIGVPGSEADRRTLSRIAAAGGTKRPDCDPERDCHFDVSAAGDLQVGLRQALQSIIGQTNSCDLPAPRADQGDRALVNVLYKPQNRPRVLVRQDTRSCDGGADGWQYAENYSRIRLCGPVCDQVKADPAGELSVVIGCPVQGPE